MESFLVDHYLWVKGAHFISVIAWMAGMLYLPRLFVYHADAKVGSELSETFKIMERRLLRFIINPAMVVTFILGGLMLWVAPDLLQEPWMHIKFTGLFLMTAVHGLYARWRKTFEHDENTHSARFYRVWNEVPTILMILIVLIAVTKPFS